MNKEIYQKDPLAFELLNNGVSKVAEFVDDGQEMKTLRFELENFVCDGGYAEGLARILRAYLDGLGKPEQQAAWVSGFFGSGKSHFVKMLRYLWVDYKFPDGATARSIVTLPQEIKDLFVELSNAARPHGGLKAAAGTLGAGATDSVRLAFLQLIFRGQGLPESLAATRFVLWLDEKGHKDPLFAYLKGLGRDPDREVRNFHVSTPLAEGLLKIDPQYGTVQNAQQALRAQFGANQQPTIEDVNNIIRQIFGTGNRLPCTLLVVDEVQQFIGESVQRALDVQEIAERCCQKLDSRVLFVGTGQSALTATPNLQRLQARFTVKVSLSDNDVERVIRQTVLAKKPQKVKTVKDALAKHQGEISRHLHNTRLAATATDDDILVLDYPLLPVRRRFWEKVLRNVDTTGTTAQLRTQLKIVYEATKASANWPVGNVIPADFIYDQVASDLLNTGLLPNEYHSIITAQRDGTKNGVLKSRLCALVFLIHQLPRKAGVDDGVRATPEVLADLMVQDLAADGAALRGAIPALLKELVDQGKLMLVDSEYCLQTREGAQWNRMFTNKRASILNDEAKIGATREALLKAALDEALRGVTSYSQGDAKESRRLNYELSTNKPADRVGEVTLWVRHGWADQKRSVEDDSRADGPESPKLFAFLPKTNHEELKNAIATELAARETIELHGVPNTREATQAKAAIETHLHAAQKRVSDCIQVAMADVQVFAGGGSPVAGLELRDKVRAAMESSVKRMFFKFADADHANWPQVTARARANDTGALSIIGYSGEVLRHPVCKLIHDALGPGKKGREVREDFMAPPFGWPKDAIDGALVVMTLSGLLRASVNGQPVTAPNLTTPNIGNATFSVDSPPLSPTQRVALRALFQKLNVSCQPNQELIAAAQFLEKLHELTRRAGGEEPLPVAPDSALIRELQGLSGNAQLLALHANTANIQSSISEWTKVAEAIVVRHARWTNLEQMARFADGLPEISEISASMQAIRSSRRLLENPDPVPPVMQRLLGILRGQLNSTQTELVGLHVEETKRLEANDSWKKTKEVDRKNLVQTNELGAPAPLDVSTEDAILQALQTRNLEGRKTLVQALPQRFRAALEQAAQLLTPKAVRVDLPQATIVLDKDLEHWVEAVREKVSKQLKKGTPVILG